MITRTASPVPGAFLDNASFPGKVTDMPAPIRRHYLPDEVERRLRESLLRGDYGETLPGERNLAEVFGVSRPTLRRAIGALVAQGWLQPVPGLPTRILKKPEARRDPSRVIAFLSSHPLRGLSAGTMLTHDLLSEALAADGYTLRFAECAAFRERRFRSALPASVNRVPADAYILHQAPEAVQAWFVEAGRPACVMGTPAQGVALPGLDTDFAPAAEHAMRMLQRQGHAPGRTLLLLPQLDLAGHRAMRAGFLRAGGSEAAVLRHPIDDSAFLPWIAREIVPRLAGGGGPTAVITGWARFTVALMTALSARFGLRLPDDLSVVCLADDPVFDMMIPQVSRYRRPAEAFVRRLARMSVMAAKGLPQPAGPVLLIPDLVEGGSVSAPPAEGARRC